MGVERRGRVIRGLLCCRSTTPGMAGEELGMGVPESSGKPFDISKRDVWDAWLKEGYSPAAAKKWRLTTAEMVSLKVVRGRR
jgi:hypothetical protein